MSKAVQRRRGTTAEHTTFTGALGELTVDTTKDTVVVHDGAAAGGFPLLREDGSNSALAIGSAGTPSLKFTGDANTGLYSPGADQVAISTGGTGRLFITSTGNVGIGTSSPYSTLSLQGSSALGALGSGAPMLTLLNADATAFNAAQIVNRDSTGAINAGITFRNDSHGASGSSALLFNVRSSGTSIAPLTLNSVGTATFQSVAAQPPALFSIGASEVARIDSSGRLLVGTSASVGASNVSSAIQVNGLGGEASATLYRFTTSASAAATPRLILARSGADTKDFTIVADGNTLGQVAFAGADGTSLNSVAATISAQVDGTPGANDMPGRLVFSTTADGAASPTEAMRINNQRELLIGTTTRTANGGVLQISNGITFPGTQSACSDANTLDDYEEGTWTPVITGGTTAGTGTYTTQSGTYTKIGRQVYITVQLTWTAHTGAGQTRVTGLPFTGASGVIAVPSMLGDGLGLSANNVAAPFFAGGTIIYIYQLPVGGGNVSDIPFDTAATVSLSLTYTV